MKQFNMHFFILLFLASSVAISDVFIYLFKTGFLETNVICGFILLIITLLLKKNKKIDFKMNFNKYDLIFIVSLILFMFFTIVFPDMSWDTRSYHIYLQENVFADKIYSDFFAGRNLNSFIFALGDRIYYFFRIILGYRLGTIFSYYLMVILFYQVKNILNKIIKECNLKMLSIVSFLPVISSVIFSYVGSYYIDNISLIFLMEIFCAVFFEDDLIKDKVKLLVLALVCGLTIGIKITNFVFIIPLVLYFLIKNLKNIKDVKWYMYICGFILVLLPWCVYAMDSYVQTGNPFFPYYNNIFMSEYFKNESWVDNNFGPKSFVQFLIWPVYILFNPKSAFDSKFVDLTWGIGFIFVLIILVKSLLKKEFKDNKKFDIAIILLISYILWEKLVIGYVRYASIILVLSSILVISEILSLNKKSIKVVLMALYIIVCLPSLVFDIGIKVKNFNNINEFGNEYFSNLKLILQDKDSWKIDNSEILGTIADDSMLSTMIRNENPIYNIEEWVTITNDKTKELYENNIKGKVICVPVDKESKDLKEEYLRRNNFEIIGIDKINDSIKFLKPGNELYIYRVIK